LIESLKPMPVELSVHSSDPPSPWEGYKQALQSGIDDSTEPTHLLVLQEDVKVSRNLPPAVEKIATTFPDDPVCLFISWLPRNVSAQCTKDLAQGKRYTLIQPGSRFAPVIAVLWPVHRAASFLEWAKTASLPGIRGECRSDDAAFGHWIASTQARVWVTNPSLVEHPDKVDSLIGRRAMWGMDKGRVALRFHEGDALDFDW
jgi:hypothetical protein